MPDEDGAPTEVYLYQGDRYIDHVEKVETFNRVMAEQTEEDVVKFIEQQKKISKFGKYVRENAIEQVGVIKKSAQAAVVEEPEELELVAMPQPTEQEIHWTPDMDMEAKGFEAL